MSMTARDYFVFSQAILNGGIYSDTRILKEESVNLMRSNQAASIPGYFGFGYGYGVATKDSGDFRNVKTGKFFWGGAFHTTFWADPARELVVVIMSQVVSSPTKNEFDAKIEAVINASYLGE